MLTVCSQLHARIECQCKHCRRSPAGCHPKSGSQDRTQTGGPATWPGCRRACALPRPRRAPSADVNRADRRRWRGGRHMRWARAAVHRSILPALPAAARPVHEWLDGPEARADLGRLGQLEWGGHLLRPLRLLLVARWDRRRRHVVRADVGGAGGVVGWCTVVGAIMFKR